MLSTRRNFLTGLGTASAAAALPWPARAAQPAVTTLNVTTSTIEVQGRTVEMLDILQPSGVRGVYTTVGTPYRVQVVNRLSAPTLIHWHGLTPPTHQDGVPILSQPALPPGQTYQYDFPLTAAGTFWMHSHEGLQEQRLCSAPLIIADPAERDRDVQDVVVELADFSFRTPQQIYAALRTPKPAATMAPGMAMKPDVNDVTYDAYLVNRRPVENPPVFRIESRARVRLRIINGSAATNFTVDLGALSGSLVAVDGRPIVPVTVNRFAIATSQRCDVVLETPGPGTYPIFAIREADTIRGAFVLATRGSHIPVYAARGQYTAPIETLQFERGLRAAHPLAPRQPDRSLAIDLTGDMATYAWSIDGVVWTDALALSGKAPHLPVKLGERVEIVMRNKTMMHHPMHLHGHSFQVVAIDGDRFPGAMRDSVLVTANRSVTIAFDAINPGWWFYHCHILYHLAAGMATSVKYV